MITKSRAVPRVPRRARGTPTGTSRSADEKGRRRSLRRRWAGPRHLDTSPMTGGSEVGRRWVKTGVRAPSRGTPGTLVVKLASSYAALRRVPSESGPVLFDVGPRHVCVPGMARDFARGPRQWGTVWRRLGEWWRIAGGSLTPPSVSGVLPESNPPGNGPQCFPVWSRLLRNPETPRLSARRSSLRTGRGPCRWVTVVWRRIWAPLRPESRRGRLVPLVLFDTVPLIGRGIQGMGQAVRIQPHRGEHPGPEADVTVIAFHGRLHVTAPDDPVLAPGQEVLAFRVEGDAQEPIRIGARVGPGVSQGLDS